MKAFCRRASARAAVKNYEGARTDYERVLELEPNNKLVQTELKAVQQARDITAAFVCSKYLSVANISHQITINAAHF